MRVINWCKSTTCTKRLIVIYTGFDFEKTLFCILIFTNYIRIGPISVRIRPELDLFLNRDLAGTGSIFFFILRSGRIRISDKNGNIRPDPDSESGTSLLKIDAEMYTFKNKEKLKKLWKIWKNNKETLWIAFFKVKFLF